MTIPTANIVDTTETLAALQKELTDNTVGAQLLKQELTEAPSCDYTVVPDMLAEQAVRASFAHLQKLGTPSAYANRFWQNFWANNDEVPAGRSAMLLDPGTKTASEQFSTGAYVAFSTQSDRGEVIDGASAESNGLDITINQTGIWLVMWSAAFAFFPKGYGNQAFGGMVANPTSLTAKVKVGGGIVITDGANQRFIAHADTVLTGKHMKESTAKMVGQQAVLKLNQGSKLRLHIHRSGGIGSYANGSANINEVIGMRKQQNVLVGGIPNRDTVNTLQLVRLS